MPAQKRATATTAAPAATEAAAGLRVLKKYPNRRLYDTQTSSYITLADVKQMVLAGETFEVRDAKTSEDLTRSILLQIILEEESGGVPMFSTQTLAHIIRFYGHSMQGMMGTLLEKNLQALAEMQGRFVDPAAGLTPLTPDAWTKFVSGQAPMMQNLMGNYLEQSRSVFEKMQQAGSIFPGMTGFPGSKK